MHEAEKPGYSLDRPAIEIVELPPDGCLSVLRHLDAPKASVVALDPTLFYLKDPDLYRLWFTLPRAAPPHPAELIRRYFGADYVMCRWDPRFREFLTNLAFDEDVRTIVNDEDWNVYDLTRR